MSKSGSKAHNLGKGDQNVYEINYPPKYIVYREQPDAGIPFTRKVYKTKWDADFVGRDEFSEKVVNEQSVSSLYDDFSPTVTSATLNILEYFGLLVPCAKILVPFSQAGGHGGAQRRSKITSPLSWARWEEKGKKWMFRVRVKMLTGIPDYLKTISGIILTPLDVDFWHAMRGLWPLALEGYEREHPDDYKRYEENPFDLHFPLILNGNVFLDGQMVLPIFRKEDVTRCFELLFFLNRTLPIPLAILAWFESRKRTRKDKKKFPSSNKLRDEVWKVFLDDFENYETNGNPKLDVLENVTFRNNFYRDHYITAYVHSHVQRGSRVVQACNKAAAKFYHAIPNGEEEPLSPEYIRTRIYYPTLRKLIIQNELYV